MKAEPSTLAEYQQPLEKDRKVVRDKDFRGMLRRLVDASRSARVIEREIAGLDKADVVECSA